MKESSHCVCWGDFTLAFLHTLFDPTSFTFRYASLLASILFTAPLLPSMDILLFGWWWTLFEVQHTQWLLHVYMAWHGMAWPYKLCGTLAAHTNHFNRHNVMRFDMRLKYFTIFHTDLFIKSCTLTHTYIRFLGWQLFETVRFSSTNK